MYFISSIPSENGNYGNPRSNQIEGDYALPDSLLTDYLSNMGFVNLTVDENNVVTKVEQNAEAYENYKKDHPSAPPEPEEPSEEDDIENMLIDHELRLSMLEMGLEEEGSET